MAREGEHILAQPHLFASDILHIEREEEPITPLCPLEHRRYAGRIIAAHRLIFSLDTTESGRGYTGTYL